MLIPMLGYAGSGDELIHFPSPTLTEAQAPLRQIQHPDFFTAYDPQLIPKNSMSFDNTIWELKIGDGVDTRNIGDLPKGSFDHAIRYGYSIQSPLSGVDYKTIRDPMSSREIFWLRKEIILPKDTQGIVFTFEGIETKAEIFLNGNIIGKHQGAFAPFDVNASSALQKGLEVPEGVKHTVLIRCEDYRIYPKKSVPEPKEIIEKRKNAALFSAEETDEPQRKILKGKRNMVENEGVIFYDAASGTHKSGGLRFVYPKAFLKRPILEGDADGFLIAQVPVQSELLGLTVNIELIDSDTHLIAATREVPVSNGQGIALLKIEDVKRWSNDTPNLYTANIQLKDPFGKTIEQIASYAGFNEIEQKNHHYYSNGQAFKIRSFLHQMKYPYGYTAPNPETFDRLTQTALSLEANEFRMHASTPTKRETYRLIHGLPTTDPQTGKIVLRGIYRTVEAPSARDLRHLADQEQAIREIEEIVYHFVRGNPGVTGMIAFNEIWGMLSHDDHWAEASDEEIEAFQWRLYHAVRKSGSVKINAEAKTALLNASHRKMNPNGFLIREITPAWTEIEKAVRADLEKPYAEGVSFKDLGAPNLLFGKGKFIERTTIFRPSGWYGISTMKNNLIVADLGSIGFSIHIYHSSGDEIRRFLGSLPPHAPWGFRAEDLPFLGDPAFPHSIIRFLMPGYQLAGSTVAPLIDEFGGKGMALPGDENVWAYGSVYSDLDRWFEDVREQLFAVTESTFFSGGWCYTQINNAAQEKNGLTTESGEFKDPSQLARWIQAFKFAKNLHEDQMNRYRQKLLPATFACSEITKLGN